jgi:hypothetical protein
MKEYIEREKLLKEIYDSDWYHITTHGTLCIGAADEETALYKAQHIFDVVKNISAADVKPVVHGEWIPIVSYFHGKPDGRYYCSVCHRVEPIKGIYCRLCGARMDGGNKNV